MLFSKVNRWLTEKGLEMKNKSRLFRGGLCLVTLAVTLVWATATRAADRYWIGSGGDWHDTANWSETSGGSGGAAVPGSGDSAIFDGHSGDCSMSSSIKVGGLHLATNFTATLTQNSAELEVLSSGYYQAGGTFLGGTKEIKITTTDRPYLLAGGHFTSTSSDLIIIRKNNTVENVFAVTNGVFNHNNGHVRIDCTTSVGASVARWNVVTLVPTSFNDLTYAGGNALSTYYSGFNTINEGDTNLVVMGDFTIEANGNLVVNEGTIEIKGNFSQYNISKGFRSGTTRLLFSGDKDQTCTVPEGNNMPAIAVAKKGGTLSTGDMTDLNVAGFEMISGNFLAPPGVLNITYPVNARATLLASYGGNYLHNNGSLRLFMSSGSLSGAKMHDIVITHPITLHNFILTGGHSSRNWQYNYNLDIAKEAYLTVAGTLTFQTDPANYWLRLNGSAIVIDGAVAVGPGADGGTTKLLFTNSNDQLYHSTGGRLPCLVVDKPSGTLGPANNATNLAAYAIELNSGTFIAPENIFDITYIPNEAVTFFKVNGGNFVHNNGTVKFARNHASNNGSRQQYVSIKHPIEFATLMLTGGHSGQSWQYRYEFEIEEPGSITVSQHLIYAADPTNYWIRTNLGELDVTGDVTIGQGTSGGTTKLRLSGTQDQTIHHNLGTPFLGNWTIDKPSGTVLLATPLTLSGTAQDLLWQSGNIDLHTNTLAVGRHLTINEGAKQLDVTVAAAGTVGNLAITGQASGIDNLTLQVNGLRSAREDSKEHTYTVLSNNTILDSELAATEWVKPWRGKVDYTANSGKDITLHSVYYSSPGTTLLVR